jgi:sulfur carrier protein ThiS
MKVWVKLYGTLGQHLPGYQLSRGIEVEIPGRAMVQDLLDLLEISESQGAVVVVENQILKADDRIPRGAPVIILQAVGGG